MSLSTSPALAASHRRVALSVRYGTVLFPFDVAAFLNALPESGYVLQEELQVPLSHIDGFTSVEGPIARRLETTVQIDTKRQVLGVVSPEPSLCISELDGLEALLRTRFHLDSPALAQFYEVVAVWVLDAGRSPLESWSNGFSAVPLIGRFSQLLGRDLSPYGLRLAARDASPNQYDWFDLRIEPHVLSPNDKHLVHLVFRNPQRTVVEGFVRTLDATVKDLVKLVEGIS